MTHLWKTKEIWTFDIPSEHRLRDVYWKSARWSLRKYLQVENPKVTDVKFDERYLAVHVEVAHPKYPKEHPYFTNDDVNKLLESYMWYANATDEEVMAWFQPYVLTYDEFKEKTKEKKHD